MAPPGAESQTGLNLEATSVAEYDTTMVGDYELKPVVLSPHQGQDILDNSSNVCPTQEENDQQQTYASTALPLDQHEDVLFATLNSSFPFAPAAVTLAPAKLWSGKTEGSS